MTLKEYLNQSDPARFPKVEITRRQIKIIASHRRADGEVHHLVVFRTEHPLLAGAQYLLIEKRLYAMYPDGRARAASVFHLKD